MSRSASCGWATCRTTCAGRRWTSSASIVSWASSSHPRSQTRCRTLSRPRSTTSSATRRCCTTWECRTVRSRRSTRSCARWRRRRRSSSWSRRGPSRRATRRRWSPSKRQARPLPSSEESSKEMKTSPNSARWSHSSATWSAAAARRRVMGACWRSRAAAPTRSPISSASSTSRSATCTSARRRCRRRVATSGCATSCNPGRSRHTPTSSRCAKSSMPPLRSKGRPRRPRQCRRVPRWLRTQGWA
mmetsp:Transcript_42586/g.112093  ORF Transcript_42586/g.112093 Transcript_42586/m.112093 type:complete len:245 (-) Transcript_42586:383-1117(-)